MVRTSGNMNVSNTVDGTICCNQIPVKASSQEMAPREEEPMDCSDTCVFVCSLVYLSTVPWCPNILLRGMNSFSLIFLMNHDHNFVHSRYTTQNLNRSITTLGENIALVLTHSKDDNLSAIFWSEIHALQLCGAQPATKMQRGWLITLFNQQVRKSSLSG